MTTESKRARLEEIESGYNSVTNGVGDSPFMCDMGFLISELRAAWEREALMEEALEFYADRENWDDDQFTPSIWDDGDVDMGRRSISALAKVREMRGES